MSELDSAQTPLKRQRSRRLSNQNNAQTSALALKCPANDDKEGWEAYWKQQGQPWRTKPEIDEERQKYLEDLRRIAPDITHGIYPFKGIKLSRADVEWLLATHENGRGPIDWSDESQRMREGLDLRGVDLSDENLSLLPLACLKGGTPWGDATNEEREAMIIHLEGVNLAEAHLEGAQLSEARLEKVYLKRAHLEGAQLYATHLERAVLDGAHLEEALLDEAHLRNAYAINAHLEGAQLRGARLEGALLDEAHLETADLRDTHLEGAFLRNAHLEGANLAKAHLEGANLSGSFFDNLTNLFNISLSAKQHRCISLTDIHWGDANLAVVDWSSLTVLGDEQNAQKRNQGSRHHKNENERLQEFQSAMRAYRQLAVVLRNQGLNEDANRFAYRAQLMQRVVFRRQRKFGQYLFSYFLYLLAGYGYKPWRSFLAYLLVIGIFAVTYYQLGTHLAWNEAIVISMTAFHGRGFFSGQFHPGDPQALVAAIEAFVGLLIEVTFIATLTRRLFGQ